jgi:hypothetical protein
MKRVMLFESSDLDDVANGEARLADEMYMPPFGGCTMGGFSP